MGNLESLFNAEPSVRTVDFLTDSVFTLNGMSREQVMLFLMLHVENLFTRCLLFRSQPIDEIKKERGAKLTLGEPFLHGG